MCVKSKALLTIGVQVRTSTQTISQNQRGCDMIQMKMMYSIGHQGQVETIAFVGTEQSPQEIT